MYLTMVKNTITGFGSILRTLIMVASHATRKRDTILYPEQPVPVPPRFRGRIVLTRDPDGMSAVWRVIYVLSLAQWVVLHYKKQNVKTDAGIQSFSVLIFRVVSFVVCVKKRARQRLFR